ncbi:hypothetical protein AB0D99_09295 [Streptomyces sp. NPDC047971]|uniref:hypothetical protein n=1 Tax=Streptomyces sp. NPDC047971 TaxID=3154499 RepID=UPI0033EC9936
MRSTSSLASTVVRPSRRPGITLAVTALAALALASCGTRQSGAAAAPGKPADAVGARHTEAPAASPRQAAFAALLDEMARGCPTGPLSGPPGPAEAPGGETLPSDDPATDALEGPVTPTAGPEVELDSRDWCASNHHEERIAQGLWELRNPTPAEVRKVLNDLGYIDESIHDLKRSGATTRFFVDLRSRGGRLCVEGSAAGEETVVEKCVAPETGPFVPPARKG